MEAFLLGLLDYFGGTIFGFILVLLGIIGQLETKWFKVETPKLIQRGLLIIFGCVIILVPPALKSQLLNFPQSFQEDQSSVIPDSVNIDSSEEGSQLIQVPSIFSGPNAAGAIVIDCRVESQGPVMLWVMHEEDDLIVFSPPGGRSVNGESASQTAIRETLEETGYTIEEKKFLGSLPNGNPNFNLILAKLVHPEQAFLPFFNETVGLLWASPVRIPEKSWRFSDDRVWITDLFETHVRDCYE